MKIKIYLVLFFFYFIQSLSAEEEILFSLDNCLDQATHIFRAKVINNNGDFSISEVLRGSFNANKINIPEFSDENRINGYGPEEVIGWEVILFLIKSETNVIFDPIVYIPMDMEGHEEYRDSYRNYNMTISVLWSKEENYYCRFQMDTVSSGTFMKRGAIKQVYVQINHHSNFLKNIHKARKKKRCNAKHRILSKLYKNSIYKQKIMEEMISYDCKDHTLPFFENLMSNLSYNREHSNILKAYIVYGQQEISSKSSEIFETEFNFWKTYIPNNPTKKWWKRGNSYYDRFLFFNKLIRNLMENEIKGWREKGVEVKTFFDQLEGYNLEEDNNKIQRLIEYFLTNNQL